MANSFQVLNLRNPKYVNQEQTMIDCEIEFKKFEGQYLPFTATSYDSAEHGRDIYQRLVNGEWGEIAAYVPPTPSAE